jgi:rhomboid protease GluP
MRVEGARRDRFAAGTELPEVSRLLARTPVVTLAMLAALLAVFLLQWTLGAFDDAFETYLLGAVSGFSVRGGDVHRIVTASFVHLNVHHLLNNAIVIAYPVGFLLEGWLGRLRFFVLAGLSMIAVSGSSAWLEPSAIGAGASGVAFGLIGGLLVLAVRTGSSKAREWRALRWGLALGIPMEVAFATRFAGAAWLPHGAALLTGFAATWILQPRGAASDRAVRAIALALAALMACSALRLLGELRSLDLRDLEGSALARLREPGAGPGELAVAAGHLLDRHADSPDAVRLARELAERGLAAQPGWPRLRGQLEAIRADAAGRLAGPATPPPSGAPRSSRAPRRGRAPRGPGRGRPRAGR